MNDRLGNGYTRENSGGYTRESSSGYTRENSGGYTSPSRSTVATTRDSASSGSINDATLNVSPSRATRRPSSSASVPKLYGASEQRPMQARAGTPSGDRRLALTKRLSAATTPASSAKLSPSTLADRYTPSARERKARPASPATDSRNRSATTQRTATKPGAARRSALAPTKRTREGGREVSSRTTRDQSALRDRYNAAKFTDRKQAQRAQKAADALARGTDLATRSALAATPLTRAASGYGLGASSGYYNDPWSGYYNGNYNGNCYNWYWNNCYPSWCSWWVGSCWGYGWGSCWGWSWGWSWPCYYPSYANCWWPTYAYWGPSTIYQYVEVPVYVEEQSKEVQGAEMAPGDQNSLNHRAASEYMALGDRAFIEGRYGDAVHYYAKAIEYSPDDGVLYLVLSDALFATGDYHYAAYAIRMALEKAPELAALGLDKREFYGDPADFDQQLELLVIYQQDHFLDEDARLVLAANYLFSLQTEQCIAFLDSPFSEDTRSTEAGQLITAAAVGTLATK
jgi:tetratricopeptide (TPR) repeat protein